MGLFCSTHLVILIYYRRVLALYREQMYIVYFMFILLSVTATHTFDFKNLQADRFPGPILNLVSWLPEKAYSWPTAGCAYSNFPPNYSYIPFLLQAIYDLFVFILCTIKVRVR
jgi:hypothetical protein